MKKIISACLLIAMLLSVAICVHAASGKVWFLSDSSFEVGGTATVDTYATSMSVVQAGEANGNTSTDMYNAALHMNLGYSWICSNGPDKYGQSVTWTVADAGKEYICRVGFYTDSERTQLAGYLDSEPFTIQGKQSLTIHTKELHNAVVGEEYYVRISCSDLNAVFSEIMGSELSSFGLRLHSNGVIDGTPTKTGNCHINIKAVGQTGEDSVSYDLTVIEPFEPSLEVLDYPTQTTYMQGETFNPDGMRVKITVYDGSTVISENGKYLDYYKEPLQNLGDVKIKLSNGELFTFIYVTVVPAAGAGGAGDMPPAITLKSLPTAYVGEAYSVKIDCGDPNADFWEYYNPGKPNDLSKTGLIITDRGVLEGTPNKAGSYTFTICAGNDNGEDYATYTLVVMEASEKDPKETIATSTEPNDAANSTEDPVQKPDDPTTNSAEIIEPEDNGVTTGSVATPEKSGGLGAFFENLGGIGIVLAIGLALLLIAVIVAIVVIIIIIVVAKKRKKKKDTET